LDFLKGPRSKPPLQEARLDIWKSPRSNIPQRSKRPSKSAESGQKKDVFLRDLHEFHMFSTRLEARLDFIKGPKLRSNHPLQEGRLDHTQKVQGPTHPSERVGWTFQTVQGPCGGGPVTRKTGGGVLQRRRLPPTTASYSRWPCSGGSRSRSSGRSRRARASAEKLQSAPRRTLVHGAGLPGGVN